MGADQTVASVVHMSRVILIEKAVIADTSSKDSGEPAHRAQSRLNLCCSPT